MRRFLGDTFILPMTAKPECRLCGKEEGLDTEFARDLLYSIFNPYHRDTGKFDPSDMIKKHVEDEELRDNYDLFSSLFNDLIRNFGYINSFWIDKLEAYKEARKKAWDEIKEMLRDGDLSRSEIGLNDLIDHFYEEILEDLIEEGYIEGVIKRIHRKIIVYSNQAEKVLADKVLQLSLQNLSNKSFGEHETEKYGISIFPSEKIVEFDSFLHNFDLIDIQESLIKSALKGEIEFEEKNMVVRQPKHSEKCVYVMLIDVSDSMRGKKIIGAIEAALALKRVIRRKNHDDLHIIAFNHNLKEIEHGDILNLNARGRTDIGLALKRAREILRDATGSGIVFLITDGEPTSSYNPHLTPWKSALKEAENLKSVDATLAIIMLGREQRFLDLCNRMAKLNKKSHIFFFNDPLNLKSFFVRSYIGKRS